MFWMIAILLRRPRVIMRQWGNGDPVTVNCGQLLVIVLLSASTGEYCGGAGNLPV